MLNLRITAAAVGLCFSLSGGLAAAQPISGGPGAVAAERAEAPGAPAPAQKPVRPTAAETSGANTPTAPAQSHSAVVVELYTSQGCSSCPPADEVLSRLVGRKNVIPLALHVDYWDYIGWTDKMASPAFTARQKAYARAIGARTIYTPQLIIDGADRVAGARPMDVAELIHEHAAETTPVRLKLARKGGRVVIDAKSTQTFPKGLLVQIVRYVPEKTVSIRRGENAGRTITYHNIVTTWDTVGHWDGAAPMSMIAPADGDEPVVVILQEPGPGQILAAASLR
ncbi:DUF1223 domain-containing protein [Solirhodobacter olei]|uniref:DUF1223 domain-containing protein n=1 Tax=Solirhodobacter olei TaxID=2493082 RepID=UPI000FD9E445|nr:DUF1223 domain-containing protein [Solirhodobacter olei]